jgi:hypothetical protein
MAAGAFANGADGRTIHLSKSRRLVLDGEKERYLIVVNSVTIIAGSE